MTRLVNLVEKLLEILLELATLDNHFLFNNEIYKQIDGVAMGSPLGPTLANVFMSHMEKRWLQERIEGPDKGVAFTIEGKQHSQGQQACQEGCRLEKEQWEKIGKAHEMSVKVKSSQML